MLHVPSPGGNSKPQVILRHGDCMFFVRDGNGHTQPATIGEVTEQFGHEFVSEVIDNPGVWLTYDPDPVACVECNRATYEPVGLVGTFDFDGTNLYGMLDKTTGQLVPRKSTRTYESCLLMIDEYTEPREPAFPSLVMKAKAIGESRRRESAIHAVAMGRIAAINAVLGVIRPDEQPKPAA